jgi:hypothetical protein
MRRKIAVRKCNETSIILLLVEGEAKYEIGGVDGGARDEGLYVSS